MRPTFCHSAVFISLVLAVLPSDSASAQKLDLQSVLEHTVSGFDGDVGLYVRHLGDGRTAEINADSIFPTASMIKVPILIQAFARIEDDLLDYHAELTYRDSLLYSGVDILGSFKDREKIDLSKVIMLMITTSDNTASLWLQHLSGTGAAINKWLAENRFENTRVNSRTPGREDARQRYGWGQTTPREIAELLVTIHEGRAVSRRASEEMSRVLGNVYWNDEALSEIPPTVKVLSKQGAVSRSRSEVLLVYAPHGAYVFSVITKNQADTSWEWDNAGYQLLRDVSAALWQYFEPDSDWVPLPREDRY